MLIAISNSVNYLQVNANKTLVCPVLEYEDIIWDPFTKRNVNKLEMIQRKAGCFIYNRYSVHDSPTELCERTHLIPLKQRWRVNRLKFLSSLVDKTFKMNATRWISFSTVQLKRNHHSEFLLEMCSRVDTHKLSFFPQGLFLIRTCCQAMFTPVRINK